MGPSVRRLTALDGTEMSVTSPRRENSQAEGDFPEKFFFTYQCRFYGEENMALGFAAMNEPDHVHNTYFILFFILMPAKEIFTEIWYSKWNSQS